MSIFIITIGVLGVAALLPLAAHLANRGATADRASIAGREALNQIIVREFNNPANWLPANGIDPNLSDPNVPFSMDPNNANSPLHPLGAKAFCLDPRGVSYSITGNFPAGATAQMQRITVRPQKGADLSSLTPTPALHQIWADEISRMQDDLNFELPDDTTLPPINNMFKNDNGTPTNTADDIALKRFSDGDFSWLTTFTRDGPGDRYTMSVAIFYRRNPPTAEPAPANVTFLSGGFGGGDVTLAAGPTAQNAEQGQWVLLSSRNGPVDIFRWYRIVNSAEYNAGNPREVTLMGADWNTSLPNPQATIIPGVIAVFERTVRLETSTLWHQ